MEGNHHVYFLKSHKNFDTKIWEMMKKRGRESRRKKKKYLFLFHSL